MPDFIVVQCFECNQYQVCQKRKDKKFTCKLCNNKQSVRKIFAHSERAIQLRKYVQQKNMARGMAEEAYEDILSQQQQQQSTHSESPPDSPGAYARSPSVSSCDSKWRSYQPVSNNLEPQQPSADDDLQHEFITTLPDVARSKRPSKRSRVSKPSNRRVVRKGTSQLDASASPSTRTLSPIFSTTVAQGPLASASALPPPRRARSGGGRGDDLLTCMPGDEVVYEDVLY